jgi:hypothetical protein
MDSSRKLRSSEHYTGPPESCKQSMIKDSRRAAQAGAGMTAIVVVPGRRQLIRVIS